MATVQVPQAEGAIRIQTGAREATVYGVKDHTVTVDESELRTFLTMVPGSKLVQEESKENRRNSATTKDGK